MKLKFTLNVDRSCGFCKLRMYYVQRDVNSNSSYARYYCDVYENFKDFSSDNINSKCSQFKDKREFKKL